MSPRSSNTGSTNRRHRKPRTARPCCTTTSAAPAITIRRPTLLNHPTLDLLHELGLDGMAKGFRDIADNPEGRARTRGMARHSGRPGEHVAPAKAVRGRATTAKLRQPATVEDVDFRKPRGLDRTLFLKLASCDWIREQRHCLMTGACGTGKSLARLRTWAQGLPGEPVRPLPACVALVRRPGIGPRRRPLRQTAAPARSGRSADHG